MYFLKACHFVDIQLCYKLHICWIFYHFLLTGCIANFIFCREVISISIIDYHPNNMQTRFQESDIQHKHILKQRFKNDWLIHVASDHLSIAIFSIHYNDVIMSTMPSQITSLTIVYSAVYSYADQRKHQSSASLAFARGIHRWPVNSRTNGQSRGKRFLLMTSSWHDTCC